MFELHTPRLLLRDFAPADWPAIHALAMEPQVTRYQSWLRLHTEEQTRRWLRGVISHNQLQPRIAYNLAIELPQPREVIGWLGWGQPSDRSKGDYDFGYALHPAQWGQGYMTEALQAMVQFIFESLGATSIFGECALSNRASARVMEKAGLSLVARWPERDFGIGVAEEHLRFAIRYTDWAQRSGS
jgi:ribosomal-protein-alanine N-acetyltransferase